MNARRDHIVEIARTWIGTPYRHQSACKGAGCDCLGLIRGLWRDLIGAEPEQVPDYSMDWSEPQGEEQLWQAARRHFVPKTNGDLQQGEVVLFRMRHAAVAKHLGIVARTGHAASFIHAYSGHGVVESPLSRPWQRRIVARFDFPKEQF
jgi:NlpC/P60 family putative phage cell wall peptidase